jgi:alpha-amylase/alpha-mannosidase (GH57 family)
VSPASCGRSIPVVADNVSTMAEPLYIGILWHMHQPYYKDPVKGEYALPWTYLHAVKDYYDMGAIVLETPGARVVFNLVPSLMEQVEDYAAGTARDPFLILGEMAPSDMTDDDRRFILENFFSANRKRMIEPHRRYRELFHRAGGESSSKTDDRLRLFGDQELLDLQVWFFLAWTGEVARRHFPELGELISKGENFTARDKALLFAVHRKILKEIIPLYRKLHDTGKAELSVSPYYHPILPLLCDMKNARTSMPGVNLPVTSFRHPEDARNQIELGIRYFREIFGFTPAGIWPSEGAVSDETLDIISACGFRWGATDEGVLARSLSDGFGTGKEALYHPYTYGFPGRELGLFFRDRTLSDLIGFTYSEWSTDRAVNDFISRLQDIRHQAPESRMVSIILDGENAWEYYPENGCRFLTALYARIATTPGLEPATFSEILEKVPEKKALAHIRSGSWINANFGIWVGHPEENLAWDYLEHARSAALRHYSGLAGLLDRSGAEFGTPDTTAGLICRSLYAAEGSDWFWWYGDDHFSPHSDRFDNLFRSHLMNVYRLLGAEIPRELFEPIKTRRAAGLVREPVALITPVINGLNDDYFEWLSAGLYDLTKQTSAMHAAVHPIRSLYYGYDRHALYFRIDGASSLDALLQTDDRLVLHLTLDGTFRFIMRRDREEAVLEKRVGAEWRRLAEECRWKIRRICEIALPLTALNPAPGSTIFCSITLNRDGAEIGRWPADSLMPCRYAGEEIESENWLI